MSMPKRDGSGIEPPTRTPARVARFHGMKVERDRGDPVAALVGPAQPPEVADREGEGLVGQEVGHDRPPRTRHVLEPRSEGGGVEQVAGIEERRSAARRPATPGHRRRSPTAANCAAPAKTIDAHRHGLDRREARPRGPTVRRRIRTRSRRPRCRGPRSSEAPTALGQRHGPRGRAGRVPRSAQEGLAAGPVADDEDGVLLGRVAGRVEEARAALGRALPDPPAVVRRRAASSAPRGSPPDRRARRRGGRSRRRDRPRTRSCTGSSG